MPLESRREAGAAPRRAEEGRGRRGRWPLVAGALFLVVAAIDGWLLRSGAVRHPLAWLAGWIGLAAAMAAWRLVEVLLTVARSRRRRWSGAAEAVAWTGLLLALAAGFANWLLSLQGYIILYEGEERPLFGGAHLEAFEAGPLANAAEMGIALALAKVELRPGSGGTFTPESRLVVVDTDGERRELVIDPLHRADLGSLRLHQGAFGFAPRIVLQRDGEVFFDETVPFLTRRVAERGLSFEGRFDVAKEGVEVTGEVSLESLDEAMKGHPTLDLEVRRAGAVLGSGSLQLGHFAELDDGFRVGFAGLRYWSEIDVSRRNYSAWMRGGGWALLIGLAAWPLARLREPR